MILIWLDSGPSQLESYDPKPNATSDFHGLFAALQAKVPRMIVSETLPLCTKLADKMAFIRSVHRGNSNHFADDHWMLIGRFVSNAASLPQKYPGVGVRIPNLLSNVLRVVAIALVCPEREEQIRGSFGGRGGVGTADFWSVALLKRFCLFGLRHSCDQREQNPPKISQVTPSK